MAFPPGFLWGAAGAGHQIEGNNVSSDLWLLEHTDPTVFAEQIASYLERAAQERADSDTASYADAKEPWMLDAYRRAWEWADSTGWSGN